MDTRCKIAHSKLLAGVCPWCGRTIHHGKIFPPAAPSMPTFAMQLLADKSLQELVCERGVLSFDEAADYVIQISAEIALIHAADSRHGQLSPDKVLLVDEGKLTIVPGSDLIGEEASLTLSNDSSTLAIADYLAPEQALDSERVDGRADIYSLGCILYFMLTGSVPFPEGSIAERLLKHQREEPKAIEQIRESVPFPMAEACRKMMEKKPENRYQSIEEVVVVFDFKH